MITIIQIRKLDECIKIISYHIHDLESNRYFLFDSIKSRYIQATEMMDQIKEDFKHLRGLNFILFNNIISLIYQIEYELNLIFNLNIQIVHQFIYSHLFSN
jgi:hypothetical protein